MLVGCLSFTDSHIIHRDLKPSNIIMTENKDPIIIDFGYCQIITSRIIKTFNVGSPSYMSPEAYNKTLYSEKSDVWSLGIILY